ncbi:hypothetical protein [Salinirubrum litoreum]|uniref:hypothetical protein n=1 Tax=Salinirubrum litoreum TaxID=1126234 RepID=UPI001D086A82|nr:hypothetical protein [Salinirubrum litoreum]
MVTVLFGHRAVLFAVLFGHRAGSSENPTYLEKFRLSQLKHALGPVGDDDAITLPQCRQTCRKFLSPMTLSQFDYDGTQHKPLSQIVMPGRQRPRHCR